MSTIKRSNLPIAHGLTRRMRKQKAENDVSVETVLTENDDGK